MKLNIGHHLEEIEGISALSLGVMFSKEYFDYKAKGNVENIYVYSESFIIPVTITNHIVFHYATFLSEPRKYGPVVEDERAFLNCVCELLGRRYHVQWITATPAYTRFKCFPDNAKAIPFGSHIIDLSLDEDQLFARLHSKHRNVVRKAIKDGVTIKSGHEELLRDYMLLDHETWKRSNRNSPGHAFYQHLLSALRNNSIIYIAYKDGVAQSAALFVYDNLTCYYMYGASSSHAYAGSGNLLHWQAILDMKARGLQEYSFVGCRICEDENSKYHEIQRFKERFGGPLEIGFMFKAVLYPLAYKAWNTLLQIRTSQPTPKDVIDDEIEKWPDLPVQLQNNTLSDFITKCNNEHMPRITESGNPYVK